MSKLKGAVSHYEAKVAELRTDRELPQEHLQPRISTAFIQGLGKD